MNIVLGDFYLSRLKTHSKDTILHSQDTRVTLEEFHEQVLQTAGWLRAQGAQPGDVIAVWMVNRVEWLVLLFAIARIGCTLAAVNTRYKAGDVEHVLAKSGATMLVMDSKFLKIDFVEILKGVDLSRTPHLRHVGIFTDEEAPLPVLSSLTVSRFAPEAHHAQDGLVDAHDPQTPCILFVTSGTTRQPKLVGHCADTLYYNAGKVIESQDYDQNTRLLAALPMCGVFCLMGVVTNLLAGGQTIIMETFEGGHAARLILEHGITHLYGSEELYLRIADNLPPQASLDFARFYGIASFNASLRVVGPRLLELGFPLGSVYGSSEILGYVTTFDDHSDIETRLTPGGYPIAGQAFEMRVRDLETGELLPADTSGALEVRSPANFVGYFNDPDETRDAITEDGYFKTGDMARITADGALIFEGRMGDAYRLSGYLVNAEEIEDVMNSIPGVREAHFVVVRHNDDNYPAAFVALQADSQLTSADILQSLRHQLASYKVPRSLWIVDEFPMAHGTNGSKVRKEVLRATTLEHLAASE